MILKGLFGLFIHTHTFLIEEKVFKVRHVNPALASLCGGSLEITLTVPLNEHETRQLRTL